MKLKGMVENPSRTQTSCADSQLVKRAAGGEGKAVQKNKCERLEGGRQEERGEEGSERAREHGPGKRSSP